MGFKLLILTSGPEGEPNGAFYSKDWISKLENLVPDIDITLCGKTEEASPKINQFDAAFGYLSEELIKSATNLKWLACPQAGPPKGFYNETLINSSIVVTNIKGIYSDHISTHVMSYILSFSRGLHKYIKNQLNSKWSTAVPTIHLPDSIALIVGVGGIGKETSRLCKAFGMKVFGVDPKTTELKNIIEEIYPPSNLKDILPVADFVISTVPETPNSKKMFASYEFKLMKHSAYFINIGRGVTVSLNDLAQAIDLGEIAGAALDVFETEPLPDNHPLWLQDNVIITPHVAAEGPYLEDRRTDIFINNCIKFNKGEQLINVVDKAQWF
tara:strand:+ start:368 stop:1348 length:981 start_codon:yes stop_codon:yes gene_type:complete